MQRLDNEDFKLSQQAGPVRPVLRHAAFHGAALSGVWNLEIQAVGEFVSFATLGNVTADVGLV